MTFRSHLLKIPKTIIFIVFGPSGRDHDSQNQLYLILGTARYSKQERKTPTHFWGNHIPWKYNHFGIGNSKQKKQRKDGGRVIPKIG